MSKHHLTRRQFGAVSAFATLSASGLAQAAPEPPKIVKLGTIDLDLVETTPVVFQGRVYRYEYVRPGYKPNTTGDSYSRFINHETGEATPPFAKGYHLGSAAVDGDLAMVTAVNIWNGERRVFVRICG